MSNKDRLSTLLMQMTMAVLVMVVLWFYWPILSLLIYNYGHQRRLFLRTALAAGQWLSYLP